MLFAVYCSLISRTFWLIPYTGTFFMLIGMLKKTGILTVKSNQYKLKTANLQKAKLQNTILKLLYLIKYIQKSKVLSNICFRFHKAF